jgi:serine/threonine-protein kinase
MHLDVSDDGMLFQVQELVAGAPLAAVLGEEPLPPREVARIGAVLASALEAAHAAGVVHRDVKPSNIMLSHVPPGLKVLDFGISKLARDVQDAREEKLTASSHLVGTPEYMSPEQVLTPESITERSDVYMLGLVLFRMLAGRGPYGATGASQYLVAHAYDAPAELASLAPAVPAPLASIVTRCLAKQPALRPSSAEVREALEHEAQDAPAAPEVARAWMEARERSDVTLRAAITRSAR